MSTLAVVRRSFADGAFWFADGASVEMPNNWDSPAPVVERDGALHVSVAREVEVEVDVRLGASLSTGVPVLRDRISVPSGYVRVGDDRESYVKVAPGVYDVAVWMTSPVDAERVEIVLSRAQ